VGKDTFLRSFDLMRPFGAVVNYGNASGNVPPFNLMLLAQKGCLALHRPGFGFHAATPETRRRRRNHTLRAKNPLNPAKLEQA